MSHPLHTEDLSSKYPAIELLVQLGYRYLSPEEVLDLRGGREGNVILDEVLRAQLKRINRIQRGRNMPAIEFPDASIQTAIAALKEMPLHEGSMVANQKAWELLRLGKSLENIIEGDKKSDTLHYIDWEKPQNNVFHVTEEFAVTRAGRQETYRPDIVLFVNGIPICVIECKRGDSKHPIDSAISQHIRNQQEDGIRSLYVYSQLLLALALNQASYATTETVPKFWAAWEEKHEGKSRAKNEESQLLELLNRPLPDALWEKMYARLGYQQMRLLKEKAALPRSISLQDQYLYWLCRPERLLDLAGNFILFEGGVKKIARYQQYFAIHKVMDRIGHIYEGHRQGGVIWHTQGSGKSLTMVMLAQHIARAIPSPKIVLVTDRVELDDQITKTFGRIDANAAINAKSGKDLVALLEGTTDAVVTTVINKFEAAVEAIKTPLESPDIFVLIDEGHRTQYGSFNVKMRQVLPNACFLAFTGTPLMKREKHTARHFGGIIDSYTVVQAVKDKAVVPILYEGRHALQEVNQGALDRGFMMVMEDASEAEQAEMRKRFSREEFVSKTEQKIHEVARDISKHFSENWGRNRSGEREGLKGMVVTPDKHTAVLYKEAFDLIGKVSTELVISAVDDREGNDDPNSGPSDKVVAYWRKMVDRYGRDSKAIEEKIRDRFQKEDDPELLIVVDKLLTGFDEPKVVVMYLCRKLQGHTLLQAIARTNRLENGKDYGLVVDYSGVLEQLWEAMQLYAYEGDYNHEDLDGTLTAISNEYAKLPDAYADLKDLFKTLPNPHDIPGHLNLLADEAVRTLFYTRFNAFARLLKLAHCSLEWEQKTSPKQKQQYDQDLAKYASLRNMAIHQYSDKSNFQQYERQLQKLLDQHVQTEKIIRLTELVSISDKDAFAAELEKLVGAAAKAETIASRTTKYINERMEEDPAYYLKLSELIRLTIAEYHARRISELEYLERMKDLQNRALDHEGEGVPEKLAGKEVAQTFFREFKARIGDRLKDLNEDVLADLALGVDEIIRSQIVVDWKQNLDVCKRIEWKIGDLLLDELREKYKIGIGMGEIDGFASACLEIAKHRY